MRIGLGLGLTRRGGGAFTPASLFASSESGAWYDPSDLATLWQDTAGTTPAVVNSTVARMDDKSGNGFHMLQATAASQPTLRQSGSTYYLEFDGVADIMRCATAPALYTASGYFAAFGHRAIVAALDKYLVAQTLSTNADRSFITLARSAQGGAGGTSSDSGHLYWSDTAAVVLAASAVTSTGSFTAGADRVLQVQDTGSGLQEYSDGAAGTARAYTRTGNTITTDQFSIGGAYNGATAINFMNARFYGGIIVAGLQASAAQRANTLTYLAAKQGRTL